MNGFECDLTNEKGEEYTIYRTIGDLFGFCSQSVFLQDCELGTVTVNLSQDSKYSQNKF